MYTLTASNNRNKTLIAKILAVTGFTILFALMVEVLSPTFAVLGLHAHHLSSAGQIFYFKQFFWRVLFYAWGYGMVGLVLAIFFKNLVASIAALFLLPVTVEPLIGLLLSSSQQQYLPFTALSSVIDNGILFLAPNQLSAEKSAIIFMIYLIIAWVIAWFAFLRRDAN